MSKELNIEGALSRLEEVAAKMESAEISIEKSLTLYKEGLDLSVFLAKALETAKQEIVVLQKGADGLFEKPFEE